MKKVVSLALVLCVLIVALSGCGSAGGSNALQKYADEQNKIYKEMSTDEMQISCTVDGTKLVYSYTYNIDGVDEDIAQMALDAMDSSAGTLLSAAQAVDKKCSAVVIEYKDTSGKVLASKEYK